MATASKTVMSSKQEQLFAEIALCGAMVLGIGHPGAYANLVGEVTVRKQSDHQAKDDLIIDSGDGRCHVHVDWSRVKQAVLGDHHGEGKLSFYDGDTSLFEIFRMGEKFPPAVEKLVGDLV